MKLRWSSRAASDRRSILRYIAADNYDAAFENDDRIWNAAVSLLDFQEKGRRGRVKRTLELVVPNTPYILAY